MSLLNLNTPAGRGPRSKKSLKMFMGAGLLVAVLGIGSTLAASITLNSPGGTTEFGQGVTQTVYCGGETSVTITPLSVYVNTVVGSPTGGSNEVSFTGRFANQYESDSTWVEQSSGQSLVNGKTGWWLATTGTTASLASSQNLSTVSTNATSWVFTERVQKPSDSSKWGYKRVKNVVTEKVVITAAVAPTPGATTAASFKVGGVLISNIPSTCKDKDFVISAYAQTGGTPTTLISKSPEVVKEVAVAFTRVPGSAISSTDRTILTPSTLVSATQTLSTIKILFDSSTGGAALTADGLFKLVVETQEDAIA